MKPLLSALNSNRSLAAIGLLLGIGVFVVAVLTLPTPHPRNSENTALINSSTSPAEDKPSKENFAWKGSTKDPKYIIIPTISAEGFIQKADVDQNKQIAVPDNIHLAAWFVQSSAPGDLGLSIIDGHLNGRQNNGIFMNLNKLKAGDQFKIELGGGAIKKFQVVSLKTVATPEASNILFSQEPSITSQLNLITCAGTYDAKLQSYDERLIVYSKLIK
jgi:LPXTG-site transpeptidase (sortase) family protein